MGDLYFVILYSENVYMNRLTTDELVYAVTYLDYSTMSWHFIAIWKSDCLDLFTLWIVADQPVAPLLKTSIMKIAITISSESLLDNPAGSKRLVHGRDL